MMPKGTTVKNVLLTDFCEMLFFFTLLYYMRSQKNKDYVVKRPFPCNLNTYYLYYDNYNLTL